MERNFSLHFYLSNSFTRIGISINCNTIPGIACKKAPAIKAEKGNASIPKITTLTIPHTILPLSIAANKEK